jgi:hypothetical protein
MRRKVKLNKINLTRDEQFGAKIPLWMKGKQRGHRQKNNNKEETYSAGGFEKIFK